MDALKRPQIWRVLGFIVVLLGFYTLVFEDSTRGVIYLGGGAAMLLILGRQSPALPSDEEKKQ